MRQQDVLNALEDLLDRERLFLLRGDLDSVGRQGEEMRRLCDAVADTVDEAWLDRVRRKAVHNRSLLDSVGAGVRSAIARVCEIRGAMQAHQTYSTDGRKERIGLQAATLERRA